MSHRPPPTPTPHPPPPTQVLAIEQRIARLLRVGDTTTVQRLRQQLGQGGVNGFTEEFITIALKVLERRQELQLFSERKSVRRLR